MKDIIPHWTILCSVFNMWVVVCVSNMYHRYLVGWQFGPCVVCLLSTYIVMNNNLIAHMSLLEVLTHATLVKP